MTKHLWPTWLASFLILVTGCAVGESESKIHAEGEGPLSVRSSGGGTLTFPGVLPGGPRTVSATFGVFPMCSVDNSVIELRTARWLHRGSAKRAEVLVREVPAASDREASTDWGPGVVHGYPGSNVEPLPGAFVGLKGVSVSQPCEPPPGPHAERRDLVFAVETEQNGYEFSDLMVDYEVGGKPYTLKIAYRLRVCGTVLEAEEACSAPEL